VATDWKYARDVIIDGENGIIVPYTDGQQEFNEAVERLLLHSELTARLRRGALKAAKRYTAEEAWRVLCKYIQLRLDYH